MPIITSEDSKNLAQLEEQLSGLLNKVSDGERGIYKQILSLAETMQKNLQNQEKYLRVKRDVSKNMENLAREGRSDLTQKEVEEFKETINEEADIGEKTRVFVNALKDLEAQARSFIDRKKEYADSIKVVASLRRDIVNINTKLETEKNKMIAADSLQKLEDLLTDKTREFQRVKADRDKKLAQLNNEVAEIGKLWIALKNTIVEFTW
ncbi:MAG: hypothetical protein RBG13Loki_1657 [Promethearchaeota archaeon CR_4]|nr:MAG: hypothetical protein RBG13Loki_1657 [Candidatus Lokiarchaeota archaeon CR_4]